MCILCVVQRWSRRVATMLPWLVIPLIMLWALSQLLPPGLRFEVTSPRLACVMVLLITLFWYEIFMPRLSLWRAQRSARIRERRRNQAIELQKLRKTATRRCRNCLTPYRDQNPGGGKFMCSYCGHISKRPVLDLPGPPGSSGIISDLIAKNGWIGSQEWPAEGNGSLVSPIPRYRVNIGDDWCLTEKSYSGVFVFVCKLLSSFFLSVRWLGRKIFRIGSSRGDGSLDSDHKGVLSKRGENGETCQESRGEKARRKAEEKRQARLEKEMLEEEERKQREEVARLIEERRKIRDEKLEAEKEQLKGPDPEGERDRRKESEKRRQERRKDKDKGSNKSNSDGEELEKRTSRESERKREFDKKKDSEKRDFQKTAIESHKQHIAEIAHGLKGMATKPRYFDRMKGSILSSSKGFNGATFFGKGALIPPASVNKFTKPATGYVDHAPIFANRREAHSSGHVTGKLSSNGDEKTSANACHQPVGSHLQPQKTVLKKSWHHLFRSSAVSPLPDTNTFSSPNQNDHLEVQTAKLPDQHESTIHASSNHDSFGQSFPSMCPLMNGTPGSSVSPMKTKSTFSLVGELGQSLPSEVDELFEDPCYDPDPVSLLGSVSESLNFPSDLVTGFLPNPKIDGTHIRKNVSTSADVSKPSPIESPISRSRVSEERHIASRRRPSTPKARDTNDESNHAIEHGTWQMWGTPQDGLGLVRASILTQEQKKANQEDIVHHNFMIPPIGNENHVLPGALSPLTVRAGNCPNGGTFSPLGSSLADNDPWSPNGVFQSVPGDGESHFSPLNLGNNIDRNDVNYESPNRSAAGHPFELSPANCWSKSDWAVCGAEDVGNSTIAKPHLGGLFPPHPDAQSFWSFDEKRG